VDDKHRTRNHANLDLGGTKIERLEVLQELPITHLAISGGTEVKTLRGLEKTPLEELDARFAYNLESLEGLPTGQLRKLSFESSLVPSLKGLENAPKLEHLNFGWTLMTRKQRKEIKPKQWIAGPLVESDRKIILTLPSLGSVIGEFTPEDEALVRKSLKAPGDLTNMKPGGPP